MTFYKYRQLNPDEQCALVQERLARGMPRHRPPHLEQGARYYLLTAAVYEHKALIDPAARRDQFQETLLAAFDQAAIEVVAWVVLPNHYHLLAWLPALGNVATIFNQLHGRTSRQWNVEDQQQGQRVWYRYSDRVIRDEAHFYRTLNYIHANPVHHDYVQRSRDWRWSSLKRYVETLGMEWIESTWRRYPVDDFGKGWDDNIGVVPDVEAMRDNGDTTTA
jgi:putative transposase